MDPDLDLPRCDDDDIIFPNAEPFPATAPSPVTGAGLLNLSPAVPQERESSESANAPLRRKRREPKALAVDEDKNCTMLI